MFKYPVRTFIQIVATLLMSARLQAAVPVPLPGDAPVPVEKLRIDNPAVLSTNGAWRFQLDHGATIHGKSQRTYASASSSQMPAVNALDGDVKTRWCASSDHLPEWWQAQLDEVESVCGLDIQWEYPDGHYKFLVGVSLDGRAWRTVLDRTNDAGMSSGSISFAAAEARFVRITVTGASDANAARKWASITEVKIKINRAGNVVEWKPADHPMSSDFAATDFDDRGWPEIPVPSNWEVLGYSMPTYGEVDDAVGLYRRAIDVPAGFAGKRVLWHFDGVTDAAEIFVNGSRMAYHEGGFTAFDVDLTDKIIPGKSNLLAVRVFKNTSTVDLDTGDYWLLGGIHRDSYLVALPATAIRDVTIMTKLDDKCVNATLKAHVEVRGARGSTVTVRGELFSFDRVKVDLPELRASGKIGDDGVAHLNLEASVTKPKLWSAEKPNLYYLVLTLTDGDERVETIQQRFGFRQVEIKGDSILWNGMPIKCTGTCRHEEWADVGHALTEQMWQTDVAMMKAANINAVRTSHYNHAQRFLELCEEKGIYVLDEIPACWVKPSDLSLKDAFVQHAAETLARDKNFACVLAWSCGNESGWGPDFKAMVDYVAATDPTRPRFVSEVQRTTDPNLSINDHHYPQDASLLKYSTMVGAGPHVITEGPHTFYNKGAQDYDFGQHDLWGEALAATWNRVWPSRRILGSFIWEWQDQGLADKFPERSDIDPNDGLRRENYKGIVSAYRVAKPEMYHVKMVYSPVMVEAREVQPTGDTLVVEITNRYSFTNLDELTCHWQLIAGDRELQHGNVKVSCPPGESALARFSAVPDMDTLRLSFQHPDGREVFSTRLHVAGMPRPQPPKKFEARGALKFSQNDQVAQFEYGRAKIAIDRRSGQISIYKSNSSVPLLAGPILNLGEALNDDGDFLNRSDVPWISSSAPPQLRNVRLVAGLVGPQQFSGRATVSGDVGWKGAESNVARLTYTIDIRADFTMDFAYELHWTSPDVQAWELGVKFEALKSFDTLCWLRNGQWTDYPPDHIGANVGGSLRDSISFHSSKHNAVWTSLGDAAGKNGITLIAGASPLHVRGNAHADGISLLASTMIAAQRSFSSGYLDQYRIRFREGQTYGSSFSIELVGNK